jgi:low temperature requirement protein LtrA
MLLLGGMAGFLVLSLAIPRAFTGDGVVFGAAYAAIVLIHGGLFTRSQRGESGRSILLIAPHNLAMALLIVIAGAVQGSAQYFLWCAAIAFIAYNTIPGPRGSFDLAPSHFVERHGLVVIVALGESVVAVGIGASGQPLSAGMICVAVLGLALSACLWWVYFGERGDERVLRAFGASAGIRRQALALSVFYYWHLLILLGIVALASALEQAIAHPADTLSTGRALALGGGAALFMVGEALIRRSLATGPSGWRLVAALISLATIPLAAWVSALAQLAALVAGVAACLAAERLRDGRQGSSAPA